MKKEKEKHISKDEHQVAEEEAGPKNSWIPDDSIHSITGSDQTDSNYDWLEDDKGNFILHDKSSNEKMGVTQKKDGSFEVEGALTPEKAEAIVERAAAQGRGVLRAVHNASQDELRIMWLAGNSREPSVDVAGFKPTEKDLENLKKIRMNKGFTPSLPTFRVTQIKLTSAALANGLSPNNWKQLDNKEAFSDFPPDKIPELTPGVVRRIFENKLVLSPEQIKNLEPRQLKGQPIPPKHIEEQLSPEQKIALGTSAPSNSNNRSTTRRNTI